MTTLQKVVPHKMPEGIECKNLKLKYLLKSKINSPNLRATANYPIDKPQFVIIIVGSSRRDKVITSGIIAINSPTRKNIASQLDNTTCRK